MDTTTARLNVIRGRGKIAATGTLDELVALARQGKLRPHDRISGITPAGPVALHAVPELAPLVPTPGEYLTARSPRALLIFDAVMAPLLIFMLAMVISRARGLPPNALFPLALFVALFGLPVIPLWRNHRRIRALRRSGIVGGPLLDLQPADQAFRTLLGHRAPVTRLLVGSIVVAFVASLVDPGDWLRMHLAKINARIAEGEAWRLVTAMFLHAGFFHLLLNAAALGEFGRVVENLFGWRRLLIVYLLAGMTGFIASFLVTPAASVGASGGIFGLMGLLIAFGLRHRAALPVATRKRFTTEIGVCIGVNIALGLSSTFIDNAAHMGGLLTGAAFGLGLGIQPHVAALLAQPLASGTVCRRDNA